MQGSRIPLQSSAATDWQSFSSLWEPPCPESVLWWTGWSKWVSVSSCKLDPFGGGRWEAALLLKALFELWPKIHLSWACFPIRTRKKNCCVSWSVCVTIHYTPKEVKPGDLRAGELGLTTDLDVPKLRGKARLIIQTGPALGRAIPHLSCWFCSPVNLIYLSPLTPRVFMH